MVCWELLVEFSVKEIFTPTLGRASNRNRGRLGTLSLSGSRFSPFLSLLLFEIVVARSLVLLGVMNTESKGGFQAEEKVLPSLDDLCLSKDNRQVPPV